MVTQLTETEEVSRLRLAARVASLPDADVTPPSSHHAVIGGMRLHWVDWGNEAAAPILFLHGGGINARSWDTVCLALRSEFHCIALDQRGHGDSEWSPEMDYVPEAHLRDIEGFAEHLGLSRFLLVGQSMGGMNAMLYASRHSDHLCGLVLVDVGPNVRASGAEAIRSFMRETMEVDSLDVFVDQALAFQPLRDPDLLRMSVMHNVRRMPDGRWMRKNDMRYFLRVEMAELIGRAQAAWDWLPNIKCPVLVTRGEHSTVFLDADADELVARLPKARPLVISGAGHNIQGDNPRELASAITEFSEGLGNGEEE